MFVHINLDELHTRNKENILLNECMENGTSFVVDNTNPTKADRAKYILAAKEHGYTVKGYYFRSSISDSVDIPSWQKRGIGVYFQDVPKEGYNPVKDEKVVTQRRELFADYELPIGEEYRDFILRFLKVSE